MAVTRALRTQLQLWHARAAFASYHRSRENPACMYTGPRSEALPIEEAMRRMHPSRPVSCDQWASPLGPSEYTRLKQSEHRGRRDSRRGGQYQRPCWIALRRRVNFKEKPRALDLERAVRFPLRLHVLGLRQLIPATVRNSCAVRIATCCCESGVWLVQSRENPRTSELKEREILHYDAQARQRSRDVQRLHPSIAADVMSDSSSSSVPVDGSRSHTRPYLPRPAVCCNRAPRRRADRLCCAP